MTKKSCPAAPRKSDIRRVVHLLRAPVGGLFRHVYDLAIEQCARDLRVGIVCDSLTGPEHSDSVIDELVRLCQLGLHRLPIHRTPGWSDFRSMRAVASVVAQLSPDILHGHGAKGGAYARMIAPDCGAKAVYTPHGGSLHFSYSTLPGAAYLTMERLLKHRAQGIIFESEFARKSYLDKVGSPDCPTRVIHNGLRDSEFSDVPGSSNDFDFVFIGELRKIKGIDVFLDAVAQVAAHRKISVLIVGEGDKAKTIRSRIASAEFASCVTWSPPVYPAARTLAKARCVVVPSLAESLPYIVLETLAARVPLLATKVGGIPEIFGPLNNLLLPPNDSAALAVAMIDILENPASALAQVKSLQNHVKQHFLLSTMVDKTNCFYQGLDE